MPFFYGFHWIPPKEWWNFPWLPCRRSICQELRAATLPCQAQQQRCRGAGAQAQGVQLATGTATPRGWGSYGYPLVMTNIAIENGHRNSGFSH